VRGTWGTHLQWLYLLPPGTRATRQVINNWKANPGYYSLYFRNCATLVEGVLNAPGWKVPYFTAPVSVELWLTDVDGYSSYWTN
jgi:hypothetical protein